MSDCVLFPASTSRNRVGSSWAGRESYLSLVDGTFTHIKPRVQPFSISRLGWLAYVRTVYRDSANNESHSLSTLGKDAFDFPVFKPPFKRFGADSQSGSSYSWRYIIYCHLIELSLLLVLSYHECPAMSSMSW